MRAIIRKEHIRNVNILVFQESHNLVSYLLMNRFRYQIPNPHQSVDVLHVDFGSQLIHRGLRLVG